MKKKMLMMSNKFLNQINNFCLVSPQWTLTESDETKMFEHTIAKDFFENMNLEALTHITDWL